MALAGALLITPDTLLIRLSGLESWGLTFWRGLLIGSSLMFLWLFTEGRNAASQIPCLLTIPALCILLATTSSTLAFNFATIETSITVVLTALATAPVLAAGLSFLILREAAPMRTWFAIAFTMLGVFIVIFHGDGAQHAPQGNVWMGGALGVLAALSMAFIFVISRRYPNVPVLLASSLGIMLSGLCGFIVADTGSILAANMIPVLLMGLIVMPVSWALLALAPRHTSPINVSLFMLLEMVLGPFWVWLGVGEQPSLEMIGGAALVLATLIVFFLASAREAHRDRPSA